MLDIASAGKITGQAITPYLFETSLEHFHFELRCISNHTACRFAEKARFFRSLLAGRRSVAASCFTFFKGKTL